MGKTDVATPGTDVITIEQVEDILLHGGDMPAISSEELQDDMVRRIIGAADLREAFAGFVATPADDIEGMMVDVIGVAWVRSAFDEGPAVYALLKVVGAEDRLERTVSMGGRSLMASFVWAQRNEAMPIRGTFRKEQSRSNANRAFWTFVLPPLEG